METVRLRDSNSTRVKKPLTCALINHVIDHYISVDSNTCSSTSLDHCAKLVPGSHTRVEPIADGLVPFDRVSLGGLEAWGVVRGLHTRNTRAETDDPSRNTPTPRHARWQAIPSPPYSLDTRMSKGTRETSG